jgi:UDP-N-acetylmuramate dehydrogenase
LGDLQKKNIFEIQSLSAIPGTVGAAAFGNIGAFGTEVKKYIFGVWAFDIDRREFIFLDNEKLDFAYRSSYLKKNREKFLIYSVVFDFSAKFQKQMKEKYADGEYFSLSHFAKKHNLGKIKKSEIRKNIKKVRRTIYPDLKKLPNVGSTFKNTEVDKKKLKELLKKYPEMPH